MHAFEVYLFSPLETCLFLSLASVLVMILLEQILSLELLLLLFTAVLDQGFFVRLMMVGMSVGLTVVLFFVG
jgi:hypothetical protein